MRPLVVKHMQHAGLDIPLGLQVADDRVVFPAIPQPSNDIIEFLRPLIPQIVIQMPLVAKVLRLIHVL
jgi:hypothetical protein